MHAARVVAAGGRGQDRQKEGLRAPSPLLARQGLGQRVERAAERLGPLGADFLDLGVVGLDAPAHVERGRVARCHEIPPRGIIQVEPRGAVGPLPGQDEGGGGAPLGYLMAPTVKPETKRLTKKL